MGKHSEHGSQAKRKIKYLDIFKTIDHRPSTRELAGMMGISANQVSRDIRELALQEELNNVSQIIEFEEDNNWASETYILTDFNPLCLIYI